MLTEDDLRYLTAVERAAVMWETWMTRFTALGATPPEAEAFCREAMVFTQQQVPPDSKSFELAYHWIVREIMTGIREVGTQ